jgi:hypothetical protein
MAVLLKISLLIAATRLQIQAAIKWVAGREIVQIIKQKIMAITVKVNINDMMKRSFDSLQREIDIRVTRAFQMACKETITWAKQNHEYTQQTGALNSSTGFQLYKDGTLVDSYFEQSIGGDDKDGAKAKGLKAGQQTASQRAAELGAHICAVMVAGMPYAIYVEGNGKDVLTAAEKQFPAILEKWLKESFTDSQGISYQINV